MSNYSDVLRRYRRHQPKGRALLYSFMGLEAVESTSSGTWVEADDGRRYLDLGSFSVFLFGHRPQPIVDAVQAQLGLMPLSTRTLLDEPSVAAAEALAGTWEGKNTKVLFGSSGAESVEAAIKLARLRTGRSALLFMEGSYHGKTTGALALTDSPVIMAGVGPLLPDVHRVVRGDLEAAYDLIEKVRPAALFIEPIQGEGGVHVFSAEEICGLADAVHSIGGLVIADEIQCGFGRTGQPWRSLDLGVAVDIILCGKSLGGGVVPASALLARSDAFQPFDQDPLKHTSTFAGNPLAAVAISAAVDLLARWNVAASVAAIDQQLGKGLQIVAEAQGAWIERVSGEGALFGIHCRSAEIAGELLRYLAAEQVLVTPCLSVPHVLRVSPPATITTGEIDFFLAAIVRALQTTADTLRTPPPPKS